MSRLAVSVDGRSHEVVVTLQGAMAEVSLDGARVQVTLPASEVGARALEWIMVDDRPYEIVFDPDLRWIRTYGGLHRLEVHDLAETRPRPCGSDGRVKAPIPGQVTRLMVETGQHVEAGQALLVLEAMKMENEIATPMAGKVSALQVSPGQTVTLNQLLAEVTP